jgi:hypothetical protein
MLPIAAINGHDLQTAIGSSPNGAGQVLEASFEPADNPAGGVFKIVEKDTGRVILQLPFPSPPAIGGATERRPVDITV